MQSTSFFKVQKRAVLLSWNKWLCTVIILLINVISRGLGSAFGPTLPSILLHRDDLYLTHAHDWRCTMNTHEMLNDGLVPSQLYTFVNLYKVRRAFRQKADGLLISEAFSTGMMCDESMKKWERYSFLSVQKLRTLQCKARHFYNQMSEVIFFLLLFSISPYSRMVLSFLLFTNNLSACAIKASM